MTDTQATPPFLRIINTQATTSYTGTYRHRGHTYITWKTGQTHFGTEATPLSLSQKPESVCTVCTETECIE